LKIITVSHQKGGVGKSTLSLNLATCLKGAGLKVGILDTDLQGSLHDTAHTFEGIDFVPAEQLDNFQNLDYDFLVIDTPPYLTNLLSDLFAISDYVLIPTTMGVYDVLAIRATLKIIREVQKTKPTLKYGVALNRVRSNTSLVDDIVDMLKSYDANVLKTRIHERVSYARSALTNGVFGSEDTKAQNEVFNLTEEIINELN
jgi:chromosome partitioning protein